MKTQESRRISLNSESWQLVYCDSLIKPRNGTTNVGQQLSSLLLSLFNIPNVSGRKNTKVNNDRCVSVQTIGPRNRSHRNALSEPPRFGADAFILIQS